MTTNPENPYSYTPVEAIKPVQPDFTDGKLFINTLFLIMLAYVIIMTIILPKLLAILNLKHFHAYVLCMILFNIVIVGGGIFYTYVKCKKVKVIFIKASLKGVSFFEFVKNLFLIYASFWIIMKVMTFLFQTLNWEITQHPVADMIKSMSSAEMVVMGFIVIIIVPITEEIFFRRILYTAASYISGNDKFGLIFTCCSFAIVHQIPVALLAYFFIAYTLQKAYNKSGNILDAIFLHMAFNFCQFSLIILLKLIGVTP